MPTRLEALSEGVVRDDNDALTFLVDAGFLRRTPTGQYARVTDGLVVPPFRMAKVSFVQARTGQKVS